jgi:hypothetical protein
VDISQLVWLCQVQIALGTDMCPNHFIHVYSYLLQWPALYMFQFQHDTSVPYLCYLLGLLVDILVSFHTDKAVQHSVPHVLSPI